MGGSPARPYGRPAGRLADRPGPPSVDAGRARRSPGDPVNEHGLPVTGLYAYGKSSPRQRPAIPPPPPRRRRAQRAAEPAAEPPGPPVPPAGPPLPLRLRGRLARLPEQPPAATTATPGPPGSIMT